LVLSPLFGAGLAALVAAEAAERAAAQAHDPDPPVANPAPNPDGVLAR